MNNGKSKLNLSQKFGDFLQNLENLLGKTERPHLLFMHFQVLNPKFQTYESSYYEKFVFILNLEDEDEDCYEQNYDKLDLSKFKANWTNWKAANSRTTSHWYSTNITNPWTLTIPFKDSQIRMNIIEKEMIRTNQSSYGKTFTPSMRLMHQK